MSRSVETAKRVLRDLLKSRKVGGSAKLIISTVKGNLKVSLEQSFPHHRNVASSMPKASKRADASHLRRKVRRAADPLVQQRAAAHRGGHQPAHRAAEHVSKSAYDPEVSSEEGEYITSPEKERASATFNPHLQISPEKEEEREEVEEEREAAEEAEAEKPLRPRVVVPDDYVNMGEHRGLGRAVLGRQHRKG